MRIRRDNSPFTILGVSVNATDEEVKDAYRRFAMRCHPDRNPSDQAEEEFKRISFAYSLIKDEHSRKKVTEILQMYEDSVGRGGIPRGSKFSGHQELDPALRPKKVKADNRTYIPGSAVTAEIMLAFYQAFRLERIPFKMLVFVPVMLLLHWIHADGELSPARVFSAIWQAMLGSLITDMLLQFAERTNRHHLRAIVNRYVVWIIILSLGALFVSIDVRGVAMVSHIGANIDIVRAISVMCISLSFYSWFVFCFLFDSHHPTWETSLVWIGVIGVIYFTFFQLL